MDQDQTFKIEFILPKLTKNLKISLDGEIPYEVNQENKKHKMSCTRTIYLND